MSKVSPRGATQAVKAAPSAGRRALSKLDKRERIQAAAFELFTTQGYEATTTKAVAAQAEVAAGTLFLYASDKADLLCLVMHDRLAATVDAAFASLPARAPLLEQWMHIFGGIFAMYAEHPGLTAAFVRHFPGSTGPSGQKVNGLTFSFLLRIAELVRDKQQAGEISREIEPLSAAANVFSLYFGALMSWLSGMCTLEAALSPGLERALALQIRGLRL